MAKQKSKRWSYSRWSVFDKCRLQYFFIYIKKLARGTSPALERGLDIHAKAENYVLGKIRGLPKELNKFKAEFNNLKKLHKEGYAFTEADVSINSHWKLSNREMTDYFMGFIDCLVFDKEHESCVVIDYKTGKQYKSHQDQAHVYAMAALAIEPNLKEVEVEFWYLDSGATSRWYYKREMFDRMQNLWINRIEEMHNCKDFEATPTKLCGWCDFSGKKGGPCEYG